MTKDKQIEEMAKVIDKSHWRIEQDFTGCHINSTEIAEAFYNAGYRKAFEIAEELCLKIYAISKGINDRIVENGRFDSYDAGSSTVLGLIIAVVNEFRKKYTEGCNGIHSNSNS